LLIRFKELGPTVKTEGDVTIGNDVWIVYGALILSGVAIGVGSVGAGSVLAKDVKPYAIVAGNPAARKPFYAFQEGFHRNSPHAETLQPGSGNTK
jgi:acetyltransferase-like isoleucine patch superfamily enzyme